MNKYEFGNMENEWNAFMEQHNELGTRTVPVASASAKFAVGLLRNRGSKVYIANPRKMSEIFKSYKKTDRNDAKILAKKLKNCEHPELYPPLREIDANSSLVRYRGSLADEVARVKNQVHSTLA